MPRAEDGAPPVAPGRVLVAGSINMDLVVTAPRHPRVGETLLGHAALRFPGGKGSNQAVAAARSGAPTAFIGAVGEDDAGSELRTFLERSGVAVDHLSVVRGADSGLAYVVVADGDNAVVVIPGANAHVGPEAIARVAIGAGDVLVSQFEIAERTVHAFFERGKAAGARTVLNPSPMRPFADRLWELSDVVVVNELELRHLCAARGVGVGADGPLAGLQALLVREDQAIVATLGADGCVVAARDEVVAVPGHAASVLDTTGAGDCFLGWVAGRLLHGDDLLSATGVANRASSLCVQRMGAGSSMPTADEVRQLTG